MAAARIYVYIYTICICINIYTHIYIHTRQRRPTIRFVTQNDFRATLQTSLRRILLADRNDRCNFTLFFSSPSLSQHPDTGAEHNKEVRRSGILLRRLREDRE